MLRRYSVFGLEHAIMSLKAVSRQGNQLGSQCDYQHLGHQTPAGVPQLSPASRFTGNPKFWSLMYNRTLIVDEFRINK